MPRDLVWHSYLDCMLPCRLCFFLTEMLSVYRILNLGVFNRLHKVSNHKLVSFQAFASAALGSGWQGRLFGGIMKGSCAKRTLITTAASTMGQFAPWLAHRGTVDATLYSTEKARVRFSDCWSKGKEAGGALENARSNFADIASWGTRCKARSSIQDTRVFNIKVPGRGGCAGRLWRCEMPFAALGPGPCFARVLVPEDL